MANLTIKDIAKICGVGISTVSRAINDDPGINQNTRKRILKVIKEYNYVPVVKWIISYKRNTGYICMADKNGVIVEEGRIEKIYK